MFQRSALRAAVELYQRGYGPRRIFDTLAAQGLEAKGPFELPMTQEQLADATGLTPVHVNRVLKQLGAEGLICARLAKQAGARVLRAVADATNVPYGFFTADLTVLEEPPGEVGQLKLMIKRIEEKREDLRQKRRDLEETLAELDQAEESCVERLVELGVNT